MQDWTGHCAIVTGGASGLGVATALRLAEAGLNVALFDLNDEKGQAHGARLGGTFRGRRRVGPGVGRRRP